jgi:hypothetical protein
MLYNFREVIEQQTLVNSGENDKKKLSMLLELVEDAIRKMSGIVDVFNSDTFYTQENQYRNLEIQYKFVNVCNFLKDGNEVEPRHLRKLRDKIKEFDRYLKSYCLREKDFLTQTEIGVFNKITQLNQILLEHLLKNEFLRLDFADKFIDYVFYRPLELVCEHPWITIAFIATVSGLFLSFYYVPYVHLKNLNKDVEVTQFKVRNQWRNTCGLHGVYNLMCFMHGKNDDQIRTLLADDSAFNLAQQTCMRINGTADNLDGVQVQRLLDAYNVPTEARTNLMVLESTPANNVLERLGHIASDAPSVLNSTAAAGVHSVVNIPAAPQRFNAGQPQYFLVNDGGRHWLPFTFKRDSSALGGVRVLTAESNLNGNVTTCPAITYICRFLTGRDTTSSVPIVSVVPAAH